ncbi:MAG: hypothetical protein WBA29_00185 [Xanthobacteraceae bacterium]
MARILAIDTVLRDGVFVQTPERLPNKFKFSVAQGMQLCRADATHERRLAKVRRDDG